MLAFDEVWPADLPALRPLRLNLRRSCGAVSSHRHGKGTRRGGGADADREGGGHGGPVFLMPMHREGKGVEGRCGFVARATLDSTVDDNHPNS